MPIYEYECPDGHSVDHYFRRHTDAPETLPCEAVTCFDHGCDCGKPAHRVISCPAKANIKRDWNERANEARRDPYTQAKAQLEGAARTSEELHGKKFKVTEEAIQVTAKKIDDDNKGIGRKPPLHKRQIRQLQAETKRRKQEQG